MNNENSFETFLYIGKKKISILIWKNDTKDKLYENEFILKNESINSELCQLEKFLSSNILQIEKYLKRFIKKIILIIDHEEPFKIKLSLKKKNYGNFLNDKSLGLLLKDARSQIKENYDDKVIAHMIIDKYLADENSFTSLPDNVKFDNLSLEINFVCYSKDLFNELKEKLGNYHIEIKQILSARYIKDYFRNDEKDKKMDIFSMCQKIIDGHNNNEILLVQKTRKNQGFFEKFFNFFS